MKRFKKSEDAQKLLTRDQVSELAAISLSPDADICKYHCHWM